MKLFVLSVIVDERFNQIIELSTSLFVENMEKTIHAYNYTLKLFLSLDVKNNKQIEKLHAPANLQGKTHPKTRYIDSLS